MRPCHLYTIFSMLLLLAACHSQKSAVSESQTKVEFDSTSVQSRQTLSLASHAMTMQAWLEGAKSQFCADSIVFADGTVIYNPRHQAEVDHADIAMASSDSALIVASDSTQSAIHANLDHNSKTKTAQLTDAAKPNPIIWIIALALGSLYIATKLKS